MPGEADTLFPPSLSVLAQAQARGLWDEGLVPLPQFFLQRCFTADVSETQR